MNKLSIYSWIASSLTLILGFLFLHFELVDYGATFFMIFPLAVGFAMGTHQYTTRVVLSFALTLLTFFGFLLAGELEGLICVLMAAPIFILMMFIGYKAQQKYQKRKLKNHQKLMVTLTPLVLLLLLNPIEQMIMPEPELITIETSILLDYPPELVFDQVKQMEKLDAIKPIGLRLGLPSPYKCELEADTVGALRNCLFENGKIVAQITNYKKGEILEMDVIDYTLTGRDWFQFVDATYTFKAINGQTEITRTSSYKSILNPRLYWEPIERWGIQQEHEFVLNSLKKNLDELELD